MPDKAFEVQTTQQVSAVDDGQTIQMVFVGAAGSVELHFKAEQFEQDLKRIIDIVGAARKARQAKTAN